MRLGVFSIPRTQASQASILTQPACKASKRCQYQSDTRQRPHPADFAFSDDHRLFYESTQVLYMCATVKQQEDLRYITHVNMHTATPRRHDTRRFDYTSRLWLQKVIVAAFAPNGGGATGKRLVAIVYVDGPANGAPNPGLTPRVSRRSVTLVMREHRCQPITVTIDNSMPRSAPSSKSALRNSLSSRCGKRHSSSVPNDTVQLRSATQTPVGERGVDRSSFVGEITLREARIVFLHSHAGCAWVRRKTNCSLSKVPIKSVRRSSVRGPHNQTSATHECSTLPVVRRKLIAVLWLRKQPRLLYFEACHDHPRAGCEHCDNLPRQFVC